MPQALQTREIVYVKEQKGVMLSFSIPEDMLPQRMDSATIFCGDDPESKFPSGGQGKLRNLLAGLLPIENCKKIEFVHVARNKKSTDFKVVCADTKRSISVRGRVDAALRVCGFELMFENDL